MKQLKFIMTISDEQWNKQKKSTNCKQRNSFSDGYLGKSRMPLLFDNVVLLHNSLCKCHLLYLHEILILNLIFIPSLNKWLFQVIWKIRINISANDFVLYLE